MKSVEQQLLKIMFKSNGRLDTYTLFKRSRLSFKDFTVSSKELVKRQFLKEEGMLFFLTEEGKKKALTLDHSGSFKKSWRQIPDSFRGPKVSVHDLYIPSLKRLNKADFGFND